MLLKNSTSFHFPSLFSTRWNIHVIYEILFKIIFILAIERKVNFSLNIQRKFLRHDYFFFCDIFIPVKKPQSHCTHRKRTFFGVAKSSCQNPILSIHNLWCVLKWVNWKERWWLNNHIAMLYFVIIESRDSFMILFPRRSTQKNSPIK